MSNELKYNQPKYELGQRLTIDVEIFDVNAENRAYLVRIGNRNTWVKEINITTSLAKQQPTTDRAQMAAMIYGDVMKSSESESAKDILKFLGKENEAYKYPEHWIEYNSKMAVLHADAIISELNKEHE